MNRVFKNRRGAIYCARQWIRWMGAINWSRLRGAINCAPTVILCILCFPTLAQDTGTEPQAPPSSTVVSQPRHATNGSGGSEQGGGQSAQIDEFSGAVTYSFEIPVPPARGSIRPTISLNYNSHRKNPNSWVGHGWELDMGSITRLPEKGQINFENGTSFQVTFAGSSEQITCSAQPMDPARYADYQINPIPGRVVAYPCHAKVEAAFNEYVHTTSVATDGSVSDQGWHVFDKSGLHYEFGRGTYATEHGPSTNQVFRWFLNRVVDPNGNALNIRYGENRNPDLIEYENQGITIELHSTGGVATHKNYFPIYRQTFLNREQLGSVLDEIIVKAEGQRLMRFAFNYSPARGFGVHQLTHIQQYGRTDVAEMPEVHFDYVSGSTISLSTDAILEPARETEYVGGRLQFIDFNGDGRPDKLRSIDGQWDMRVAYNNGNGFDAEVTLSDPLENSGCNPDYCRGKLQWNNGPDALYLFLMDMNGDALPDRVVRFRDNNNRADFVIALHNGHSWSNNLVRWQDPYIGRSAGELGKNLGLIDMNGDGLVDRVIGVQEETRAYFNVFYNTGSGFNPIPVEWNDPILVVDPENSGRGQIQGGDALNSHTFIRDMNGDGLPDRVWRANIYEYDSANNASSRIGFVVALNKNGKSWASPTLDPTHSTRTDPRIYYNGIDVLGMVDPVTDPNHAGILSRVADWMDFNNDGYLDRVYGDRTQGKFRVWFFNGMEWADAVGGLGYSIELEDPISSGGGEGVGWIRSNWNEKTTSFFQDMNGDGYPDRVANTKRTASYAGSNEFEIYPLLASPVNLEIGGSTQKINQPIGVLNRISSKLPNSTLSDSVIRYLPSTYPIEPAPLHRFLPYNLYLPREVHTLDPYHGQGSPVAAAPLSQYRKTTYIFTGGNHYIRTGEREVSFNGFQRVEKINHTTPETKMVNFYHQASGDVAPNFASSFDATGYTHYSLSGRPYKKETYETVGAPELLVLETSIWGINRTLNNPDEYHCAGICNPQLFIQRKEVWEPGTNMGTRPGLSRISQIAFEYDALGNITKKIDQDKYGHEILTQETRYYPKRSFTQALLIADHPQEQWQSKGSTKYRRKSFGYDDRGNPIREKHFLEVGNDQSLTLDIQRVFDGHGNLHRQTDIDGITKEFSYQDPDGILPDGLFPFVEHTIRTAGSSPWVWRKYHRLTGEVRWERDQTGIEKETHFDDYGRPLEEWIKDRQGNSHLLKRYVYEYLPATIEDWTNLVIQKTQVFEPQPGFPETTTTPVSISYADGAGQVLQQCVYSERGNYREMFHRSLHDGRRKVQTEPRFVQTCSFQSKIPSALRWYSTSVDFFGRTLRKDTPPGESNSPAGNVTYAYETLSNGLLKKTTHLPITSQQKIELYDETDRLTAADGPGTGDTLKYEYNPVGDLRFVKDSQNNVFTEIIYDDLGRKTSMNDSDMGTWQYHYDTHGRMDYQIDAKDQKISFVYDDLGRVVEKEYRGSQPQNRPLIRKELTRYDSWVLAGHDVILGELASVSEVNANQQTIRETYYGYDPDFRRLHKITRTISNVGSFVQTLVHDYRGKVQSTVFPGGERLFYEYNRLGSLEKICPNTCTAQSPVYYAINSLTDYDVYGSLLKEGFGNGTTSEYLYYPNSHRLQQKQTKKGTQIYSDRTYTYDKHANIKTIRDGLHPTGFASGGLSQVIYDSNDRIDTYTPATNNQLINMDYDPRGNLLVNGASYPGRRYEYNDPAHKHAVTAVGQDRYEYDTNGNMTRDPYRDLMAYDVRNKLTRVAMKNGVVVEYDYDYTDARVLKKVTRTDPLGVVTMAVTHYLGDALEIKGDKVLLHIHAGEKRIATKTLGTLSQILAATTSSLRQTNYLPDGVHLAMVMPFLMFFLGMAFIASFRPVRHPDNFVLHPQRRHPGIFVWQKYPGSMTYTLRSLRTYALSLWSFYTQTCIETLNQFPHRMAAKLVTLFLIFTILANPFVVWAGDTADLPANQNDENYFFYYHGDHLGSSHLLTEGKDASVHSGITYRSGDLLQRFEYDVFGKEKYVLNPNLSFEPSFTGQLYDMETGLYYYKARYYSPLLGRFIQPDTIVPDTKNLQAYNRYSYVVNNPLKYTDPSGHGFWSVFRAVLGAFIGALISVLSFGALAPAGVALAALSFSQIVVFGALSGLAGGIVGGAITGGVRGALMGAAFGFIGGAVFGAAGFGLSAVVGNVASIAIMAGVGASLSYATGGWKGLLTFGAGVAGSLTGAAMSKSLAQTISRSKQQLSSGYEKSNFHFEYDNPDTGVRLADAGASNPNVATDAVRAGAPTSSSAPNPKGYLDINVSIPGVTGGIIIDSAGYSYVYGGPAIASLGFSVTASPNAVSTGWNFGAQVGRWSGFQVGYGGGSKFFEFGMVTPGFSFSSYYIIRVPNAATHWR